MGTSRVPCPSISQLEGPGVQVLLQEEQGCPRAHLPARSTRGMGQGCWLLGFHIRGANGQSKDSTQPKSGKHGDKVIDTTLAQPCNAVSQQLICTWVLLRIQQ